MSLQKYQDCITACSACAVECAHCESTCLNEENIKNLARCIKLTHDCAAMCLFALEAMSSASEFAKQICSLCADMCNTCALECEKQTTMEDCLRCAEACRKCAVECHNMNRMEFAKLSS